MWVSLEINGYYSQACVVTKKLTKNNPLVQYNVFLYSCGQEYKCIHSHIREVLITHAIPAKKPQLSAYFLKKDSRW